MVIGRLRGMDAGPQLSVQLQEGVEGKRGWRFWTRATGTLVGAAWDVSLGLTPTSDYQPPASPVTGVRVVLVDPATDKIVHASDWFTDAIAAEPERVRYVSLVATLPQADVLAALSED